MRTDELRHATTARPTRTVPGLAAALGALTAAMSIAGGAAPATATTVIAKSFHSLAVEADGVFAGVVTDVRPYRRADGHIWTAVRFGDLRWIVAPGDAAAAPPDEKELHFAGGRIGELAEVVGGMPQFAVGQRVVLFYRDDETASPIVGFHQGCFGLREGDDGGAAVFTGDHRPVLAVAGDELVTGAVPGAAAGDAALAGGAAAEAMSLDEFAAAVARQRRQDDR